MTVITAATNEEAEEKKGQLLSCGDIDVALALFGGWTGIDMSQYNDEGDFRFTNDYSVRSVIDKWSTTAPGSEKMLWNKKRMAECIILGGYGAEITGDEATVADELLGWVDVGGADGFNFWAITVPDTFDDIIDFVAPELEKRGLLRPEPVKQGTTAREVFSGSAWLSENHPGHKYSWISAETPPDFPTHDN